MASMILNGRDRTPQAKKLAEYMVERGEGVDVSHDAIAKLIGEVRGSQPYRTVIQRARKILLMEYGFYLDSILNIGYKLLVVDDHLRKSARKSRQAYRMQVRALGVASAIAEERMNDDQRSKRDFLQNQIASVVAFAADKTRIAMLTVGKPKTLER